MSILRDQKNRYERVAAVSSTQAFSIAERTLTILRRGINPETAVDLAKIIKEENRRRRRGHHR